MNEWRINTQSYSDLCPTAFERRSDLHLDFLPVLTVNKADQNYIGSCGPNSKSSEVCLVIYSVSADLCSTLSLPAICESTTKLIGLSFVQRCGLVAS